MTPKVAGAYNVANNVIKLKCHYVCLAVGCGGWPFESLLARCTLLAVAELAVDIVPPLIPNWPDWIEGHRVAVVDSVQNEPALRTLSHGLVTVVCSTFPAQQSPSSSSQPAPVTKNALTDRQQEKSARLGNDASRPEQENTKPDNF